MGGGEGARQGRRRPPVVLGQCGADRHVARGQESPEDPDGSGFRLLVESFHLGDGQVGHLGDFGDDLFVDVPVSETVGRSETDGPAVGAVLP